MQYSEAKQGRIFVIRLEDGDIVHDEIERFAREKSIGAAGLIIVGGADHGSKFVVGPEEGRATPVVPMEHVLDEVHEIAGVGTLSRTMKEILCSICTWRAAGSHLPLPGVSVKVSGCGMSWK